MKSKGPIPLLNNWPPQKEELRDWIIENCYRPTLKRGTRAYRIIQRLKNKGPLRYKDLCDMEKQWRRTNPSVGYGLGLGYSQLIANMLAHGQIQRIEPGLYEYVEPIKFVTNKN